MVVGPKLRGYCDTQKKKKKKTGDKSSGKKKKCDCAQWQQLIMQFISNVDQNLNGILGVQFLLYL